MVKRNGFLILGLIVLIMFFGFFYTIGAGERGILLTFSKPSENIEGEGLHFKFPFVQKVVKFDIKTQKYEVGASSASKDLQIVSTTIAVNYRLSQESVLTIYKEIGVEYHDRIINPAIQEVVKASTAKFTAEELITKRELVKEEIQLRLQERLLAYGLFVEAISIVNFDFSESFNSAIEAKVTAEQRALEEKNKLAQVEYEAQQTVTKATAEAQAIRIQSQALNENPDILQLRAIEKWDGIMPKVTSGAIPFINIE